MSVSPEAAGAVITVDRVPDVVHTGRRALFIARQSVHAGMAPSLAAMSVAAVGYLPPGAGALTREAIDPAAIHPDTFVAGSERVTKCASRSPSERPSGAPPATSRTKSGSPQRR